MNQTFVQEMKEALLKEQSSLRGELGVIADPAKGADNFTAKFPNFGNEQDDNVQEVQSYTDNLSVESNFQTSLQEVDAALARIENGTYGKCENCGEEIAEDRLRAFPAAALCTKCKAETKV